ncbi:MAG: tRNA-guanine transglycosylase, partial [Pseudomonadota bacterium]
AKKGKKLIIMDPRGQDMMRHASHSLKFKPGTDVAMLNAMIHTIIDEELYDAQYIQANASGFEALKEKVKDFAPEQMSEVCGIDAETLKDVARIYATSERSIIFWGMGVSQHTHGTDNSRCLIALALITGHVGREGTGLHPLRGQNNVQGASDAGLIPMFFPDYRSVENADIRGQMEDFWGRALDPVKGLTVVEIMDAIHEGDITGMYVMGENPAMSDPDQNHARAALAMLDHLVVQDIFLTETCWHADVVLPASAHAEKLGTYSNTNRQVQIGRPALEVAARTASSLGLDGCSRIRIARVLMDFGRFPGETPRGADHLRRFALNYPFSDLLDFRKKRMVLERWYDGCSDVLEPVVRGRSVMLGIHTYDPHNESGTGRPDISIITRPIGYQENSRMPLGVFDPLFPDELAECTADRVLRDRLSITMEKANLRVAHNYPYCFPEGSVEVRSMVWFFFDWLRRRFQAARPETITDPAYDLVWDMLLNTNLRSAESDALRGHIHHFRRAPKGRAALFRRALAAMGLGTPPQMLEMIARGVDMFDCVHPTRSARHGLAFTPEGPLHIKNARFERDPASLTPECHPHLARFSRAYLRHLFKAGEMLALRLLSFHNLDFYLRLMRGAREAIQAGEFTAFKDDFCARYQTNRGQ